MLAELLLLANIESLVSIQLTARALCFSYASPAIIKWCQSITTIPATQQRDTCIHVLECCKTLIYLSAIKTMLPCCGWNKHFIALLVEGFELFFRSNYNLKACFPLLIPMPQHLPQAPSRGQPFPGDAADAECPHRSTWERLALQRLHRIVWKAETLSPGGKRRTESGLNVKARFL